ncbi:hypothetical protein CTEN210_12657 [Chaetoceros tenuissimus]|uniref:RING-type domain-containing protein n=1 Tax=Chaetoceros tenuissimus TaxID=426638 RepID=A0AAD3D3P3_9STRA|nr:hypothetical protein CTEN210_12657 [Chaetoceros tenuissimus]
MPDINTKDLEDAKANLERVASRLESAVTEAGKKKAELKQKKNILQRRVDSSTKRYEQLEKLTKALCDDCFAILPTLGNDVHKKAASDSTYHLEQAEKACEEAKLAIKGNGTYGRSGYYSYYHLTKIEQTWKSLGIYERRCAYDDLSTKVTKKNPDKSDYLSFASNKKDTATKELEDAKYAIEQWKKYGDQHQEKLNIVQAEIKKITDQEREVLQSKLDQLGGTKRSRTTNGGTNTCVVCMDRPKEIVFQCGHQCCTTCSASMLNCPTCRVMILQRIRLYD